MSRIKLTDNIKDILVKMAEGNPGALTAMLETIKHGKQIDPQGFMEGLGALLSLDTLGVYGTEIYILWNDKCKQNTREFLMLLRANQLGFVSNTEIKTAAVDQMRQVMFSPERMDDLNKQVCDFLPRFQLREEETNKMELIGKENNES